jgi:hypothetical protein
LKRLLQKKLWDHRITEGLFAHTLAVLTLILAILLLLIEPSRPVPDPAIRTVFGILLLFVAAGYIWTGAAYFRRSPSAAIVGLVTSTALLLLSLAGRGFKGVSWLPVLAVLNYAVDIDWRKQR